MMAFHRIVAGVFPSSKSAAASLTFKTWRHSSQQGRLFHSKPNDAHPSQSHLTVNNSSNKSNNSTDAVAAFESKLAAALEKRRELGTLRALTLGEDGGGQPLVDFSSNDYLGFARSTSLRERIARRLSQASARDDQLGSTGSRLLTGNSRAAESLETRVAEYHRGPAALLFNSGYDANIGFFGAVPQRGDVVFADELSHASVNEGLRLGRARRISFKHNSVSDLESKIKQHLASRLPAAAEGNMIIAVESVYSMDGDLAPLAELSTLCREYGALLVVDEAHATGVYGVGGRGLVYGMGLHEHVYARLHTFGKGMGCHGAAIVCPPTTRAYLVNYARSFVYSTALPNDSLVAINAAYDLMQDTANDAQSHLFRLVSLFKTTVAAEGLPADATIPSDSPIQGVLLGSNAAAVHAARALRGHGFLAYPIRAPTVPAGTERIRVVLHAHNTEAEVVAFARLLVRVWRAHKQSDNHEGSVNVAGL